MHKKLLQNVLSRLFFLATIPLVAFYSCSFYQTIISDPEYAPDVFSGNIEYDKVLASKKSHPLGELNWDCTYAIVQLSSNAPSIPPSFNSGNWRYKFGGQWAPTPIPDLYKNTRDAVLFCRKYFSDEINQRIEIALINSGSWYIRDAVGETIYIYSPIEKIAARIRFGD